MVDPGLEAKHRRLVYGELDSEPEDASFVGRIGWSFNGSYQAIKAIIDWRGANEWHISSLYRPKLNEGPLGKRIAQSSSCVDFLVHALSSASFIVFRVCPYDVSPDVNCGSLGCESFRLTNEAIHL